MATWRYYVEVDGAWHRLPKAFINFNGENRFPALAGRVLRSMVALRRNDGSVRVTGTRVKFDDEGAWDQQYSADAAVARINSGDKARRARRMRVPDLAAIRAHETSGGHWRVGAAEQALVEADLMPLGARGRRVVPLLKGKVLAAPVGA